jgi:hypothetical protein
MRKATSGRLQRRLQLEGRAVVGYSFAASRFKPASKMAGKEGSHARFRRSASLQFGVQLELKFTILGCEAMG